MNKTKITETKSGKIQGIVDNNLEIFKGIPYAEPPVNELRFIPPIPKKPWTGVLETTKYSACAFQGYTELEEWFGKYQPESEDCLYLNIWTPATDNKKRPVMVWIHGGAFIMSTGNDPMYSGSVLAQRGNLVVVTINYRLGALGFLYVPGKTVNAGSQDQVLALKWVKENIHLFGGDPENITIFGESAGGYSVLSLCTMPAAKGLFRRVIAQSAPFIDPTVNDKSTKKILRQLRVKGNDLNELRKIPPEKIIEEQNKIFESDSTNILAFRPLIEPGTWPIHPQKAFEKGECKKIDLLIGTNMDEAKLFTAMKMLSKLVSEGEKALIGYFGLMGINPEKSKKIIETYKEARKGKHSVEPKEIFDAVLTDAIFRVPTVRLLEAQSSHQPNTYNYLFNWPTPAMGGKFGCCHALEIPFVFGSLDSTFKPILVINPETKALSEKIMEAWIAFARTGNPNNKTIPKWPSYDLKNRSTMVFGAECKVENAVFDNERKAWDDLLKV